VARPNRYSPMNERAAMPPKAADPEPTGQQRILLTGRGSHTVDALPGGSLEARVPKA